MARQYGIITTSTGVSDIVIQSLRTSQQAEVAEARDESGKVIDLKAYSKGVSITVEGLLDAASVSVSAGDTLTVGDTTYLIESCEVSESNTEFARVTVTARTADSATLHTYETGSN